ncbi:MAG TPA: HAMP domain-containing sensor histidine kinase [Rudaea sp.]|nr:HAMP domain-containing sensor histidine kinase [Rudaea sp.]
MAAFIRSHVRQIVAEWVDFASTLRPFSPSTDPATLQDSIIAMLTEIADDMEKPETPVEAFEKSRGRIDATAARPSAAWGHGVERLESGLEIKQVVAEFRALRAVVIRLFQQHEPSDEFRAADIVRFDEAVDQAVSETLAAYTMELDRLRNTLLAMLAHDLRGPLQAILFTGEVMKSKVQDRADVASLTDRIIVAAGRMRELIEDFLTFLTPTLGGEIPIERQIVDMIEVCHRIIAEVSATEYANRVHLQSAGDTHGCWDRARIEQVLSNLLRNAIEHGAEDRCVSVMVNGDANGVNVSVHNFGEPIPAHATNAIFKPLVRLGQHEPGKRDHLGLGLYIAKELVERHGGKIGVVSSVDDGTTFYFFLPRAA